MTPRLLVPLMIRAACFRQTHPSSFYTVIAGLFKLNHGQSGASQFLTAEKAASRRDILKIARRLNAGV
jgi:hypothetical protein